MKVLIKEARRQLVLAAKAYISKDEHGKYRMVELGREPMYLLGKPGIGKTEIVRSVAEELGIGFVSFSLTHHTRNSLLGLPVIRELPDGRKFTEFTMSEIIAAVEKSVKNGHKEGILMLDEFNSVSETILPSMLAFLQTKNIGEYSLPEGWMITLAGNPKEYNRSARALDIALLDRVRKLEIEFDEQVFLEYAKESGFHPAIISFLSLYPSYCYVMVTEEGKEEAVTARGWENLSRTLKIYEQLDFPIDAELVMQFIKSDRVIYEFMNHLALLSAGCDERQVEKVLSGLNVSDFREHCENLPDRILWMISDYLYRLIGKHERKKTPKQRLDQEVTNAFQFLEDLPSHMPLERFFSVVSRDEELVKIMVQQKNRMYIRLCKEFLAA